MYVNYNNRERYKWKVCLPSRSSKRATLLMLCKVLPSTHVVGLRLGRRRTTAGRGSHIMVLVVGLFRRIVQVDRVEGQT